MKAGSTLVLYLVGALLLVALLLELPAYAMYTGEVFIGIFLLGLFLAFGVAVRQTKKIAYQKTDSAN
ncbi:MAG: hypothetical protein JRN15_19450 [Nitrososphaerota archaeon]|jgi:hypothetical protein|nr:hypothetical protein [Nitrososphaerota archaeon]